MKLSEAIRLGSMINPQGFGSMINSATNATCALGATAVATNVIEEYFSGTSMRKLLYAKYPILESLTEHPISSRIGCIYDIIINLNDNFHWTREQIADWVEQIENTMPELQEQQLVSVGSNVEVS